MIAAVRLKLFGGFALEDESGQAITLHLRKAQALLSYLAVASGQSASREKLATLLWGEFDHQRARQSLRQVLLAITKAFADRGLTLLRLESHSVSLASDLISVDAVTFAELIADCSPDALAQASEIYAGEFLSGLSVHSPDFEDWLTETRSRFEELAVTGLSELLVQREMSGDIGGAIESAKQVLRIDCFREDLHRRLMGLYLAKGMRSSALAQFRTCREILHRELDVAPEEETVKLYKDILGQSQGGSLDANPTSVDTELQPVPEQKRINDGERRHSDVFVGREKELAQLNRLLAEAHDSRGRFVTLFGDSGIGKTQLLITFAGECGVSESRRFFARGYRSEQQVALAVWSDALAPLVTDDEHAVTAHLTESARMELDRLNPFHADCAPLGTAEADRPRFYRAVVELLRAIAQDGPIIITIDDLQWADQESLRLLFYVVRYCGSAPVLILASIRTGEPDHSSYFLSTLDDLEQEGLVKEITLQPLSESETVSLSNQILGERHSKTFPVQLRDQIWPLSEGNPRSIRELVEANLDLDQALRSGDIKLPAQAIREVSSLIQTLSDNARVVAAAASVIGEGHSFEVLCQTAGIDASEAAAALEELIAAKVLRAEADEIVFVQQRVALAVYEDLIEPRRKILHSAAADAISRMHPHALEGHLPALANHCRRAGRLREAFEFEVNAARAEANRGALGRAEALFEQALVSAKHLNADHVVCRLAADAHLGIAELAEMREDWGAAGQSLAAAERRARECDDPERLARILLAHSRVSCVLGNRESANDYVARAMVAAERAGGDCLWLPAERLLAKVHLILGHDDSIEARLTHRIEACSQLQLRVDEAQVRATRGLYLAMQGRFSDAVTDCEKAMATAESLANEACVASCLQIWGLLNCWQGEIEAGLAKLDAAGEIAKARGDLPRLYVLHGLRGYGYLSAGRDDRALEELGLAIAMSDNLGIDFFRPLFQAWIAEASLAGGNEKNSLRFSRDAFRLAARTNQPWAQSVAYRALAHALARPQFRDFPRAEQAIRSAIDAQNGLGLKFEVARSLVSQAKILRARGHARRSSEVFFKAGEMFRDMDMLAEFERARTMAEALGEPTRLRG